MKAVAPPRKSEPLLCSCFLGKDEGERRAVVAGAFPSVLLQPVAHPVACVPIGRRVNSPPVQFPDDHPVVSIETCPYRR